MFTNKTRTIQNPHFFDIDEIFNEYITNHSKKFEIYLVVYDFKLISDDVFSQRFASELEINLSKFHLKRFFLLWIEYFSESRCKFSHISEMCIITVSSIRYMIFEFYIKQPVQICELKLNMMIDENPHLINALDRMWIIL